jgi:hypothetical protein
MHTKYCAIEEKFVSTAFVGLQDLDMNDAEDKIQDEKDCSYRYIRYDCWIATKALISRRIWRALGCHTLTLHICQSRNCRRQVCSY